MALAWRVSVELLHVIFKDCAILGDFPDRRRALHAWMSSLVK